MTQPQRIVPFVVLGLLVAGFALTRFSGIYPDEVAYKIFLERFFISGGFKQDLTPYCMEGFLVRPPAILVPAAALWAQITLFGSSWFSYRILPYFSLLTIVTILARHNLRKGNHTFWPLLLLISLGTVPFAITLLRPEAIILASCMIQFFIGSRMLEERRISALCLYASAAMLLYSITVYVHPKAIYLIAVPATSLVISAMNLSGGAQRYAYLAIFSAGLVLTTLAAVDLQKRGFLVCPALPDVRFIMGGQSASPLDIATNPRRFASALRRALGAPMLNTFVHTFYRKTPEVGFVASRASLSLFDWVANLLIAICVIGVAAYVAWKFLVCLSRTKEPRERKEFYLIASVMLGLTIPYMLSIVKHFYEAGFFVCALMIMAVLLWPLGPQIGKSRPWLRNLAFCVLVGASLACISISYSDYVIPLRNGFRGANIPGFVNQSILGLQIRRMLAERQVPSNAPLIISDLTYEAVKYHPYVMPITYTSSGFNTPGITRAYMEKFAFRYGVIECNLVPSNREFPLRILLTRHFTQAYGSGRTMAFDICLFRTNFENERN